MRDNSIFFIVFLSQIILLSIYFPRKIMKRVRQVIKDYPVKQYPRLYIRSVDYYELGLKIYQFINILLLVIGFAVLVFLVVKDSQEVEPVEGVFVLFYFMLQMSPFMLMELSSFSYFKQMRKLNLKKVKTAVLQPRGLFDFISYKMIVLAVISNLLCITVVAYLDGFKLERGSDTVVLFFTLLLANLLFAFIIRLNISGKKINPLQSMTDRLKQTKTVVNTLVTMSIIQSLFVMMIQVMDYYQLDFYRSTFISLFLQVIAWISLQNSIRASCIEDIDFDVYKLDDVEKVQN